MSFILVKQQAMTTTIIHKLSSMICPFGESFPKKVATGYFYEIGPKLWARSATTCHEIKPNKLTLLFVSRQFEFKNVPPVELGRYDIAMYPNTSHRCVHYPRIPNGFPDLKQPLGFVVSSVHGGTNVDVRTDKIHSEDVDFDDGVVRSTDNPEAVHFRRMPD